MALVLIKDFYFSLQLLGISCLNSFMPCQLISLSLKSELNMLPSSIVQLEFLIFTCNAAARDFSLFLSLIELTFFFFLCFLFLFLFWLFVVSPIHMKPPR